MTKFGITRSAILFLFSTALTIVSPAQTLNTLVSLNNTNGRGPTAAPVQGADGNFYGTISSGGKGETACKASYGCGTVYRMTPKGVLTTLHNFCSEANCADGGHPTGPLVLATNGYFYGTTYGGGANGRGSVFKISPKGVLTTLYSFCATKNCTDGAYPYAGLVQATDGNLYGTTANGGIFCHAYSGCGTLFRITPEGKFTSLHSFAYTIDGENPYGTLIQATDGNLYGTTYFGGELKPGVAASGTVFKVTLAGAVTVVHPFNNATEGGYIQSGVIQASDGNLYGTTGSAGPASCSCGTVFGMTLTGKLTMLYPFHGSDGRNPYAPLVQATDGNFYGTTYEGGASIYGTIFRIAPSGANFATLISFNFKDGSGPEAGLTQGTDGILYGTTSSGGTGEAGAIYSLSMTP